MTSLDDRGPGTLRDALAQPTPLWIIFDPSIKGGQIELKSALNVKVKDITIDGYDSDITITADNNDFVPLQFRGGNTIIHGLTVDGQGTTLTGIFIREGDLYWVDHVTVTDVQDDALGLGQANKLDTSASEITISNYRVYNTIKGMLGGGNAEQPYHPLFRVTVHSSSLGARDRNPRVQTGGQVHAFNNYIHSFEYGGMDASRNSIIISENNVFSALKAGRVGNAQTGRAPTNGAPIPGHIFSEGDIFLDVAESSGSINPSNVDPFTCLLYTSPSPRDRG